MSTKPRAAKHTPFLETRDATADAKNRTKTRWGRPRQKGDKVRAPRSSVLSLEDCKRMGVEIISCGEVLDPTERETAISYVDSEKQAELTVGDYRIQRKLEKAGYVPTVVNTFKSGGTIRLYSIPKNRLSINIKRGK